MGVTAILNQLQRQLCVKRVESGKRGVMREVDPGVKVNESYDTEPN